jgi:hypothetical protein
MSNMALQILVGTALTDTRFCEGLLNGSRRSLVADFDLTDEERRVVLEIRAASIQEFAAELSEWLEEWSGDGRRPSEGMARPRSLAPPPIAQLLSPQHVGSCPGNTSGY